MDKNNREKVTKGREGKKGGGEKIVTNPFWLKLTPTQLKKLKLKSLVISC